MESSESPLSHIEIRHFMRDLSNDEAPLATLAIENTLRDLERQANSQEHVEQLGQLLSQIPESEDE